MVKVKLEPSTMEPRGFGGDLVTGIGEVILRHDNGGKWYKMIFEASSAQETTIGKKHQHRPSNSDYTGWRAN